MTITAGHQPPTTTEDQVRALIPASLFDRLVARITTEHTAITTGQAERIMTAALAYLQACALNPGAGLAPSEQVDIGWHTFILYTADYAEFCARVAGRFIHHRPDDDPGDASSLPGGRVGATVDAMRAAGLPVDIDLWVPKSSCSQCYQGCADDPSTSLGG